MRTVEDQETNLFVAVSPVLLFGVNECKNLQRKQAGNMHQVDESISFGKELDLLGYFPMVAARQWQVI